jgi:hypothetical protein
MMNYVVDEWVAESHSPIHLMQLLVYLFLVFLGLPLFEMHGLLEQSVKLNTNCLSCLL